MWLSVIHTELQYQNLNESHSYCITLQVFISAEAEKASSKMRQAQREQEDYSFVSNNQVFNNVETMDKVRFLLFVLWFSVRKFYVTNHVSKRV